MISSPGRTRTYDPAVNSRLLYQLSYRGVADTDLPGGKSSQNVSCLRRNSQGIQPEKSVSTSLPTHPAAAVITSSTLYPAAANLAWTQARLGA